MAGTGEAVSFAGKVAFVTGAAGGIGRAAALSSHGGRKRCGRRRLRAGPPRDDAHGRGAQRPRAHRPAWSIRGTPNVVLVVAS
jgi:NAD(P)-dependent dehydrogenase (short-subunit alcohol dehydrogenase family)